MRGRIFKRLGLTSAVVAFALLGAAPANAALIVNVTPVMPANVAAGQKDLAGTLTITSNSTAPDFGPYIPETIELTPSCGEFTDPWHPCAMPDPDVFAVDSPATGAAGTACAGISFTVTKVDQTTGSYGFTPAVAVSIPRDGGSCTINFTFDVLKLPSVDSKSLVAGIQTNANAFVRGHDAGPSIDDFGTDVVTVAKATPSLALANPATHPIGSPLTLLAQLTNASFAPGGPVSFQVWGPDDPTCAGPPLATIPATMAGTNFAGSAFAQLTPTAAGTYRTIATYSGDAYNSAAAPTNCGDPGSVTSVIVPTTTPPPPIVTQPPGATGQRATALKKCKRKKGKARKKCKKRALKLPV